MGRSSLLEGLQTRHRMTDLPEQCPPCPKLKPLGFVLKANHLDAMAKYASIGHRGRSNQKALITIVGGITLLPPPSSSSLKRTMVCLALKSQCIGKRHKSMGNTRPTRSTEGFDRSNQRTGICDPDVSKASAVRCMARPSVKASMIYV